MTARGVPAGAAQAVAQHGLESGHSGLGDGRHVGHQGRALGAGHGEHAQVAVLGLLVHRRNRRERHGDMAAKQVGYGRTRPLVGNMQELDARLGGEIFAADMADGADAGRAEVDLAGVRLGVGDHFRHRMNREEGGTTSVLGAVPIRPIGAKSLRGS